MQALLDTQEFVYVLYTGLALGVFLLFTGLIQLMSRRENLSEAKSRRMRMIAKGTSTADLLAVLKPPERGDILTRLPFVGNLRRDLLQAGILMGPWRFLQLCGLLTAIAVAIGLQVRPLHFALPAGFILGFALPILIVKNRRKTRTMALIHQLPDALDLLARGLRVGHPLNTSIGAVAEEMEDPIGTEFGIIFDQVSYGDDLTDAFAEFAERVDLEDVHYLSASVGIQHGTGGDLARVIQVLSDVIRGRISMRRRIKAISSEGRLTSWFLSSLPLVIYGMTSMTSPDYYSGVAEDPLYIPMAVTIVFFTVLNFLVLRKLVNFRI